MVTLEEALEAIGGGIDRPALELYVAKSWVKPPEPERFEAIDIARVRLVRHLERDLLIDGDAMDVVLKLLDQVYTLRDQMRRVERALNEQPQDVRDIILMRVAASG